MAIGLGAAATLFASGAEARWTRVESDRFVVYGEGSERVLREFAEKLMVFDAALRSFYPSTRGRKALTKVQVILVTKDDDLQRVRPGSGSGVLGFYQATDDGVFAVSIRNPDFGADDVLFHEYGHHFLLENFPMAMPAWFVEGWAEYFATTQVSSDGVRVGAYHDWRLREVLFTPGVPLEDLLSKSVGQVSPSYRSVYYAQAWQLIHYMRSDPKRAAQMDQAIQAISGGADPVKAFEASTGQTMAQLASALSHYRKLWVYTIPRDPKAPRPPTTATQLPESADALFLDQIRLYLPSRKGGEAEFLASVRRKAAQFPDDAFAQRVLARAEYALGDVAAGEAITRRRLEAAPDDAEDLLLAGVGQMLAGQRGVGDRRARFRAARPYLAKAYQALPGDYRSLSAYAWARSVEPNYPTQNDLTALLMARDMAPSAGNISFRAGAALMRLGRKPEAEVAMAAILNNPHGGRAAEAARAILAGQGVPMVSVDDDDDPPPKPPAKAK